jgi:hypothetical protein
MKKSTKEICATLRESFKQVYPVIWIKLAVLSDTDNALVSNLVKNWELLKKTKQSAPYDGIKANTYIFPGSEEGAKTKTTNRSGTLFPKSKQSITGKNQIPNIEVTVRLLISSGLCLFVSFLVVAVSCFFFCIFCIFCIFCR